MHLHPTRPRRFICGGKAAKTQTEQRPRESGPRSRDVVQVPFVVGGPGDRGFCPRPVWPAPSCCRNCQLTPCAGGISTLQRRRQLSFIEIEPERFGPRHARRQTKV